MFYSWMVYFGVYVLYDIVFYFILSLRRANLASYAVLL